MPDKKRIDVKDLRIGMYVAELDRPWLASDFLFQGFLIREEKDLVRIREVCDHVFIDVEKGDAPGGVEDDPTWVYDNLEEAPSHKPVTVDARTEFREEVSRAREARDRAGKYLDHIFHDARLGEIVRTDEAREVVAGLVETVSGNPNASLWLNSLRQRHQRVATHCMNVCVLAAAFARHLGYEQAQIEDIGVGALLHDIGILDVGTEIIEKAEPLTADERGEILKHPERGHVQVSATPGIGPMALNVIRHHHERINGQGYPSGLSGNDIPREALVVAVVDIYDNVTSDRPFAKAITPHGALSLLRQLGPEELGTDLVQEFIRCIGIYPAGSLVELANGAVGVVASHTQNSRLRPVVMLLIDPDGKTLPQRPMVNLDSLAKTDGSAGWQIDRVVSPGEYGLDLADVIDAYTSVSNESLDG
jgi:HD-GYP domain-containing protein (c-di-GMP phosphodiesterase class II)